MNNSLYSQSRSNMLILGCMVIVTLIGLSSTIFINYQLYQSHQSALRVTGNVEQTLQTLGPMIEEQRQVNQGVRYAKLDTNLAYAKHKKLLKLLQRSDISYEIKQPLVQQVELTLVKLQSARGFLESSKRATDEAGGNFRFISEQLESIKQVGKIESSLKLILTITIITMSLLTLVLFLSGGIISRNLKRIQLAAENALKANNELKQGRVQTALVTLAQQLNGEQSIEQLAQHTLNFLAPEIQASMAAFYTLQDNTLTLNQTYAYQGEESRCFKIGEGIVGQVAAQGKAIELAQPEQKELGISNIEPNRLFVTPVVDQGAVLGVIEFSLMAPLNGFQKALLKESLAAFTIAIRSAQYRTNLTELLDKAQHATRSKSDFLASMSHEIRTPLNGVLGMLHILKTTELSPKQNDYLATIHQSADALLTVINDILDFSKIEAGKIELEEAPFDLLLMAENTLEQLSPQAHEKNISLQMFIAPRVPRLVMGDSGRIRQILLNLIGNAIKFTRQGYVELDIECLQSKDNKENIEFQIKDSGIGIAEAKLSSIFGRFDQADTSTTREFGGTGLGLSISKSLVHLMGGSMSVSSQLGLGSVFRFNLLLPKQDKYLEFPAKGLNKIMLLMADTDEAHNHIIKKQISSWGIEYQHASDVQQVMNNIEQGFFDLLIIDESLDKQAAANFHANRKINPKLRNFPMILIASMTRNKLLTDGEQDRFVKVLHQPVKPSDLMDAIVEALHQPSMNSPDTSTTIMSKQLKVLDNLLFDNDNNIRILLVEDHHINQQIAQLMLEHLGVVTDVAANGEEALALLAQFPYHLVLMDCQMPVMDGYTATQEIRKSNKHYANIPIIAMTANAMAGDKEKCLAAGMDDYIAKPIEPMALASKIKSWASDGEGKIGESVDY